MRAMPERNARALLIEGYASLFGVEDLAGDVIRAGAFARSLRGAMPSMLLQHVGGRPAGKWSVAREDGRGLLVRGLVTGGHAAGRSALELIGKGRLDGLSIGFVARQWRPRPGGGRELIEVELREVSLVAAPMMPGARFKAVGTPFVAPSDPGFRRAA